jgi:hypothetical protein
MLATNPTIQITLTPQQCQQVLMQLAVAATGIPTPIGPISVTRARAPRPRAVKATTTRAVKQPASLTPNQKALHDYATRHQTILLTIPVLSEVSEFREWPAKQIGTVAAGLVRKGYFSGSSNAGWQLSNVNRTMTRGKAAA